MAGQNLLTIMIFLPIMGAIGQALVPGSKHARGVSMSALISLGTSLGSALIATLVVSGMSPQTADLQALEFMPWIGAFSINYEMGVDGLNVLLVLLNAIIFPLLIAAEWRQKQAPKGMHGLLLLLQGAFAGVICAQNLFLLFFFWALISLPFYFLIGIWGGKNREAAAFRSVVTATIGNALIFSALLLVYYAIDPHTFSIRELSGGRLAHEMIHLGSWDFSVSAAAFGLICGGLALRAPIWPLHGWFTDVASEAPPTVLVAYSAVSVPVAAYILIRIGYSLFPETLAAWSDGIVICGVVNLAMGGISAFAQRGLRLLLAFVCMSQVGVLLLGIGALTPAGLSGAVYQQLVLGLGIAGLGLFVGTMIDRVGDHIFLGDDKTATWGGVAQRAPILAVFAGIVMASLLGFPGSGGFVGSALTLIGTYANHPAAVAMASVAMLLAVYYLLAMYRLVFMGESTASATEKVVDLNLREQAYHLPVIAFLLAFGLYPKPWLELVRPTVQTLLSIVK